MLKNERGSALLLVLVTTAILFLLGTVLLTVSAAGVKNTVRQESRAQAYYIARSGAAAVATWIIDNPGDAEDLVDSGPSAPVALGEGTFVVVVTEEADGTIVIESNGIVESTGDVDDFTETATLTLLPFSSLPDDFDLAVFAYDRIELEGDVDIVGDVGTNSTERDSVRLVRRMWGILRPEIDGDLYIGHGGDQNIVIDGHRGDVEGNVYDGDHGIAREYPLPEFPNPPEDLPDRGSLTMTSWPFDVYGTDYEINADGHYSEINIVGLGATLTIDLSDDRVIRTEELNVEWGGEIELVGNGRLYLHVDKVFNLDGLFSTINSGGGPNSLFLFYRGVAPLEFTGFSGFRGSIYAKSADIMLEGINPFDTSVLGNIVTGGGKVEISGLSITEAVIYAPNALVRMGGFAILDGAIVAYQFEANYLLSGDVVTHYVDVATIREEIFPTSVFGYVMGQWQ